jgi:hypothetical protein
MDEAPDTRQLLSAHIGQKQQAVRSYLARQRPRRTRLANLSVVGSTLAATLTAGPGVGGQGFTQTLQGVFSLGDSSVVWRTLCLAAVVLSVTAALATNLATSQALADKVSAAETCSAQLEGLQVALNFGRIDVDEAVQLYQQYVTPVAFVDDTPSR